MSFKRYYAELLRRQATAAPRADEAQQDFRRALEQTRWIGPFAY